MTASHDLPPAPAPGEPAPRRTAGPTVLYVEDHPVNVLLMQALFAKRPELKLMVATHGESGWAAAQEQRPDLILLDLHLPDCHGTELLLRLREDPSLADVPAVAVTADLTVDVGWAGFVEVWRKPLDVPATLASIDRLLDARAQAAVPGTAVAEEGMAPPALAHSRPASAPAPFSTLAED
jgi:CheY-like chemotaxis protein